MKRPKHMNQANHPRRAAAITLILTVFLLILGNALPTPILAAQSVAPLPDEVTITNNTGRSDTLYLTGLTSGDRVCVYNAATAGKLLVSGTVFSTRTDLTLTVAQLGTAAGSVYISVTGKGLTESARAKIDFDAEIVTDPPSADNIVATNNVGKVDKVYIGGLYGGETVKIYNAEAGGKVIGTLAVSASKYEGTVSVNQLGTEAGTAWMTLTEKGELESARVSFSFDGEPLSVPLGEDQITVANNAGYSDVLSVMRLSLGDCVRLYDSARGGNQLGTATVAYGRTDVAITLTQLGKSAGSAYASLTESGNRESARIEVSFPAEGLSTAPSVSSATIANNSGASDVLTVTGLKAGDVVRAYDAQSGGTQLGSGTVAAGKTEATVTIAQLGETSGTLWISLVQKNLYESDRVSFSYAGEKTTDAADDESITITNNPIGKPDTLYFSGLSATDIVKVYDSATGGSLLVSGTVATSKTEITLSIAQLGADDGFVYITVKKTGKLESPRKKVAFDAEAQSEEVDVENICITNNAISSDTVEVTGLEEGDVVKVYDATGKQIGTGTVAAYSDYVVISIAQLGRSAGTVHIAITSSGMTESARISAAYDAESTSTVLASEGVLIVNRVSVADTITVSNLDEGSCVTAYDAARGGTRLASAATDVTDGEVTLTIKQLGSAAGTVYLTFTEKNAAESARSAFPYDAEPVASAPLATNVTVENQAGTSDTLTVTGLDGNDTVNVYDAAKAGEILASATADEYGTAVVLTVTQLGSAGGKVYVTRTGTDSRESLRTAVPFSAEPVTPEISATQAIIQNNAGISDVLKVSALTDGDVIRVYNAAVGGTQLGTASVAAYGNSVSVTVSQFGSAGGTTYVSCTAAGKAESARTAIPFAAESATSTSIIGGSVVTNTAGASDTILVSGLTGGSTVCAYDAATDGELLATATTGSTASTVTMTVAQLGTSSGTVYLTVKTSGKLESSRIAVTYTAERQSVAPSESNITVTNNANLSDSVEVVWLDTGDIVNVYDSAVAGSLLGSATVSGSDTEATVKIAQLGASSGTIYVSVTGKNCLESDRTAVAYALEETTTTPDSGNIQVTNNAGIKDTVAVYWLDEDDLVKVYASAAGTTALGSATVAAGDDSVEISLSQLGEDNGVVHVGVTAAGKKESARVQASYAGEQESTAPSEANILIDNLAGYSDVVTVLYLTENDKVKVYNAASGGTLLGSATVGEGESEANVSLSQLGTAAGTVYISVLEYGKTESDRVKVAYLAEQTSDSPTEADITATVYSEKSDKIAVAGLSEYDLVKVYKLSSGGTYTLLTSGTVDADETELTITVELGTSIGTVYVSVTSYGCYESEKVGMKTVAGD